MRRLVSLFALVLCSLPVGIGLSGCGSGAATSALCSNGAQQGTLQYLRLQPEVGGVSLNQGQTFRLQAAAGFDCNNANVTLSTVNYSASPNPGGPVDINPSNGELCAGTWNRNLPGGVADYTICTNNGVSGVSTVTASSAAASSNKILVYVHPLVTSIQIGKASTDCVNDPATNCPQYTAGTPSTSAPPYDPNTCVSFGRSAQIVLRVFAGSQNITYTAGHPTFALNPVGTTSTVTNGLVNIENNSGVFTAIAPGSSSVTASLSQATSSAGYLSVCPPKSIVLASTNSSNGRVTINQNTTEPLTATITDVNGVTLTGLNLTYTSSNPSSVAVASSGIVPVFPANSAINVFCLPPSCNPSPVDQVGRLGNGKPISSNPLLTTTVGAVQSRLWIGSTDSKYLSAVDLSVSQVPPPVALPFQPNSFVLTQDGSTIYMGSDQALMTFSTTSNGVTATNTSLQGRVLAVSPAGTTVVISDPARNVISLFAPPTGQGSGTIVTTHDGVGARAAYTPDGNTLYIATTDNRLLVYSTFTGWSQYDLTASGANDVAIAVPEVGAFVGGNNAVNGRSYCPNTTGPSPVYYPQASFTTLSASISDRLATTNDGLHVLDTRLAAPGSSPVMNDLLLSSTENGVTSPGLVATSDCPEDGSAPVFNTAVNTTVLNGVSASAITGVYVSSKSSTAAVTYLPVAGAAGTGAVLPIYRPAASGAGTVSAVTLANGAVAPVSGAFSADDSTFFAGTSGDNLVHFIQLSTLTDTQQINPQLPSVANPGAFAVPTFVVQHPRSATSSK